MQQCGWAKGKANCPGRFHVDVLYPSQGGVKAKPHEQAGGWHAAQADTLKKSHPIQKADSKNPEPLIRSNLR
jgi:hypothetical protein